MTIYYVSTTGSDNGTGSADSPWASINYAMAQNLQPGDTVMVAPGTYTETVAINTGGSAAGDVSLVSEVPGEALIRPTSGTYSTVNIRANYVTVKGFDVVGGDGHGIDAESVHHISVLDNTVHDSGGSGIQFNYSEFIDIEGNTVYGNSATNGYQTSGISVYENRNVSGDTTTTGFRTIIKDNVSYDNVESSAISGEHTDGNGIIIDDFQSTQNSG
ncbi:RTX toxin, partial [Thioclava sp. BHET1]